MFEKLLTWLGGAGGNEDLSPSEALGPQGAGSVLLDVREHEEWKSGHVKGAVHIPLGCLRPQLGNLARDKAIIAVCRSGSRSSRAVSILSDAGFERAANLRGGMTAWERDGLPVATRNS